MLFPLAVLLAAILLETISVVGQEPGKPLARVRAAIATGPLRTNPANPRYFTDGSGKAIYLTGSRTSARASWMVAGDAAGRGLRQCCLLEVDAR